MKESYLDDEGELINNIGISSKLFEERFSGKKMAFLGKHFGPYWVIGTAEYLEELAAKYPGGHSLFYREFEPYAFRPYQKGDTKLKIHGKKRIHHVIGEPEFIDEIFEKWSKQRDTGLSFTTILGRE